MRKLLAALLLCTFALAQDEGRDVGDERPILFVRWERTEQRGKIYLAAWQALEPHHGMPQRLRLKDLDGDEEKAKAFFAEHKQARMVIAVDDASAAVARKALPDVPVLSAGVLAGATVSVSLDRGVLAKLMKLFRPDVRYVAAPNTRARVDSVLPGLEVDLLPGLKYDTPTNPPPDWHLYWVHEGVSSPGFESVLAEMGWSARVTKGMPLVATSDALERGTATMTVLPDPESVGRKLAAVALGILRDGKEAPKKPLTVSRLRVTIDLQAARRAGYEVPLGALARADEVRRAR